MPLKRLAALLAATITLSTTQVAAQTPVTLKKAISIGLSRAPEMAAARARLDGANAQAGQARAAYLPTLSATGTAQGISIRDAEPIPPSFRTFGLVTTYTGAATASLAFRWTVYDFGRTSNAVAAADAGADAAQDGLGATEVDTISSIASAYLVASYREELRLVAEQTVTQRDRMYVIAQALVKGGLQPPIEELRAQSRLEAARRDLASAEADAADARLALASLLAIEEPVTISTPKLPNVDADVARAQRAAIARRETIRAARSAVAAKNAAVDAARARYRPTLSFNIDASYRMNATDANSSMIGNTRTGVASIVLSVPIFDWSSPTGVDAADADAAAADAQLYQTTRDAKSEAARAAVALTGADRELGFAQKAASEAAAVFAVMQARYEKGLAAPLELIDAETSDSAARSARTNAEMARALAVVRLLVATGHARRLVEEAA